MRVNKEGCACGDVELDQAQEIVYELVADGLEDAHEIYHDLDVGVDEDAHTVFFLCPSILCTVLAKHHSSPGFTSIHLAFWARHCFCNLHESIPHVAGIERPACRGHRL